MTYIRSTWAAALLGLGLFAAAAPGETISVPFIFWGGDVATFVANGGTETKAGSTFDKMGLKLRLTPGDDFDKQVADYLDNKSPFLRGTLSMLGQASEKLTAKPETTPVVFLQLTWSAGDHLVGRGAFKTLNDLKGKKIALQKGGPHVGMLNDCLRTARLDWKDITVVWTDDVSGDKGPAALFRKDAEHRRLLRHLAGDDRPLRRPRQSRRRVREDRQGGARRRLDGDDEPLHRRRVRLPQGLLRQEPRPRREVRGRLLEGLRGVGGRQAEGRPRLQGRRQAGPGRLGQRPRLQGRRGQRGRRGRADLRLHLRRPARQHRLLHGQGQPDRLRLQIGPGAGPAGRPGDAGVQERIPPASAPPTSTTTPCASSATSTARPSPRAASAPNSSSTT